MAMPETLEELQAHGYTHTGNGECRGCHAPIAWFKTPSGKPMPFSRKPGGELPKRFESHHAVCPNRDDFKGKTKKREGSNG